MKESMKKDDDSRDRWKKSVERKLAQMDKYFSVEDK